MAEMVANRTPTRMTAAEFMALPESNRIQELLDGEHIVSPSPKDNHQSCAFAIASELKEKGPSGKVRIAPMDVYFDDLNVTQPDVFWVRDEDSRCQLGDDGYWHGAPDLVVEVLSPSTAAYDRGDKFDLYEKHGVREYWLVDPEARFVEVYVLEEGAFARRGVFEPQEMFESPMLNGKAVAVSALFD